MGSTSRNVFTSLIISFSLSVFAATGNPLSSLDGQDVDKPYGDCPTHKLGGRRGYSVTTDVPMEEKVSELAFYPIDPTHAQLFLHLIFPRVMFKVQIEGSMVTLEKCDRFGRSCEQESVDSVKHPDYIKANMWNHVKVTLTEDKKLDIAVGPRMVKSISMLEHDSTDEASWSVDMKRHSRKGIDNNGPEYAYLVQFKCSGFVPRGEDSSTPGSSGTTEKGDVGTSDAPNLGTAAPHVEEPDSKTPPGGGGGLESRWIYLIIGLVVAAIVVAAIAVVAYNVIRKKRSMTFTEQSPLKHQQGQQQQQQQQQAQQ